MKIIHFDKGLKSPEIPENEFAVTIGFFDGVHRGHRFLIEQLKSIAKNSGLPSVVITFRIHPRIILQSDYQPQLLNTFDEKLSLLSNTGVDYCFVLDFTKKLSNLTAKEFIQNVLQKDLHTKKLLIGYDHRFGKDRTCDFKDYVLFGKSCGMDVVLADELMEPDLHVSSTSVRHLLSEGNVKKASSILSYNYSLKGQVISGNQMGRELGFPTANLQISDPYKVIPASGIYATWVHLADQVYKGMTYIGNRPTIISGGEQRIETHILDFSEDIYGKELKIEFVKYIREDLKFEKLDTLKSQLSQDENDTERILDKKECDSRSASHSS